MDPIFFHIDYERLAEVLITIVVLSFFIERALSVLFESRLFISRTEGKKGVKELLALVVSISVCWAWDFDALTILLASNDHMTVGGIILTGGIVAGGSKASMGLFRDLMGFMSSAAKEQKKISEAKNK